LKRKEFSAKTRKLVLQKQNYSCADCGSNYPNLQFHHIDGNSWKNHFSNCVALCPTCHDLRDRRQKSFKKLKKQLLISPIKLPNLVSITSPKLESQKWESLSEKEKSTMREIFKDFGIK